MIKGLFLASIAVVMMTACSVDEGYDTPVAPNEITFSVTPVNAHRHTPVICRTVKTCGILQCRLS